MTERVPYLGLAEFSFESASPPTTSARKLNATILSYIILAFHPVLANNLQDNGLVSSGESGRTSASPR